MFHQNNTSAAEEWRVQGRRYISTYIAKQTMNKCGTCQCEGWPFCTSRIFPKKKGVGCGMCGCTSCYTKLESRWRACVQCRNYYLDPGPVLRYNGWFEAGPSSWETLDNNLNILNIRFGWGRKMLERFTGDDGGEEVLAGVCKSLTWSKLCGC